MKSFREYLTESKKVYEFKVKIAGELDSDATKKIKLALDKYKVESCSAGRRTPIQESPVDFPNVKNVNVTTFDICLAYPTNSPQIRSAVAEGLGCTLDCVHVLSLKEEEEIALNHANDNPSGESLLTKDYEAGSEGQNLVGEKHTMSLLKDLNKDKHTNEEYTGVNDQLLAKSAPKATKADTQPKAKPIKATSPIGAKSIKLTPVASKVHNSLNVPAKG